MSIQPDHVVVPVFDLADRMRKALRVAGVGVQEMADYLGVARGTVGTWINGRITPSAQTVRLWALRTGVPYEWLRDGESPRQDGGPDGGSRGDVRPEGFEPPTFCSGAWPADDEVAAVVVGPWGEAA